MATCRGYVNSHSSGNDRARTGERLKAVLAGLLELEVLRQKHLEMVDAVLEDGAAATINTEESGAEEEYENGNPGSVEYDSATSRKQQAPSLSYRAVVPYRNGSEDCGNYPGEGTAHSSSGGGNNSRWSTLSWDVPTELLSSQTPEPSGGLESDSRPSSGFYSVSGCSLSDSCYSVSTDAALVRSASPARPLKLWEQVLLSADSDDILWSEETVLQQQPALQKQNQDDGEPAIGKPVSVQTELEASGVSFLSDLCLGHSNSLICSLLLLLQPTSSLHRKPKLDPRYCTDLVSRWTKEVYPYPSPLHAVALQSPLFTSQSQEQLVFLNSEGPQLDELQESSISQTLPPQFQHPLLIASVTLLEQYISRLARQYQSRASSATFNPASGATARPATHKGICTPVKIHGSNQSLSAFEIHKTLGITSSKSLMGKSARVNNSASGKKPTRNSINLGNLPSATGEDFNINPTPGLHSSQGLVDNSKNGGFGALGLESAAPAFMASGTLLSSATPTPALRTRPRISTCPSNLSHRSSMDVTSGSGATSVFESSALCHKSDWSSYAPSEIGKSSFGTDAGSAPSSQHDSLIKESNSCSKQCEDSPMVGENSRISGLTRAVLVGLMDHGVELDIDCFQTNTAGEMRLHSETVPTAQTDQSHDYTRLTDLNLQRPIHSPQSTHVPSPHFSLHCHNQLINSPSNLPSSTASSPASCPTLRGHSPPRPLQSTPQGATPLSVFRRDAPFQCSMPCTNRRSSPLDHVGIQPRGGSLRMSEAGRGGSCDWKREERGGLYRGRHASHKLIRAATVSSHIKQENYSSIWEKEQEQTEESERERKEVDRAEYGYGWRRNHIGNWRWEHQMMKASFSSNDKRPKEEISPMFSKKWVKGEGERRSSSLRLSSRALFRSESQGLLVHCNRSKEHVKRAQWASSLDVGQGGMYVSKGEGIRPLNTEEDKHLSSTASLFNLSCSRNLEGSSHSLALLSSSSFPPSPPPQMPLQRSLSLRNLGRRVFGSMRSLSLKRKPSKKLQ